MFTLGLFFMILNVYCVAQRHISPIIPKEKKILILFSLWCPSRKERNIKFFKLFILKIFQTYKNIAK